MNKPIKPLEELLDSVRDIEGFPIGKDEDILALSDPPFFTACPNPYINDFIDERGKHYDESTDNYHREPFAGDVSEGKNEAIYNAHTYHTKVPYKAILKYIENFTNKGDIVFDGFCGTGMTGVAAQLLDRKAILSDLSPAATYIAYNYNTPLIIEDFELNIKRILKEVEEECGWMYKTKHVEKENNIPEGLKKIREKFNKNIVGTINYTVWSDVFICPYCHEEYVFWDAAINQGKVLDEYECYHCRAKIKKTLCEKATVNFYDDFIQDTVSQIKQVPVLINYNVGKKKFSKTPDEEDLKIIEKINELDIPYWFSANRMAEGDESRRNDKVGITHIHHFYTKRNLWILSSIYNNCKTNYLRGLIVFQSIAATLCSKLTRYNLGNRGNGPVSGTLYIPSLIAESNVFNLYLRKSNDFIKAYKILAKTKNAIVSCGSCLGLNNISNDTCDYIFTDPPFGDNLMYSELNFIWESWLKVITNNKSEAIMNHSQNKTLSDYQKLMQLAFQEYYRVLKPNRWITVVFHNSKSSVWNAIQEAMSKAGFLIAQVTVLDKKQGSFKQVTAAGAVKNDLVISAYKPKQSFEHKFLEMAGEGLEEEFIKMHLSHQKTEPSVERTEQMLYSKLLAYYVLRSYAIKYDATTFYKMLRSNFAEEDGYWFNKEQIDDYREYKQKMKLEGIEDLKSGQMMMFIDCEKTAIIWLHTFLDTSKDFQTIYPAFTKIANISGDNVPELTELLDKNFVAENGKYRRPQTEDEKIFVTQKRERELQREFDVLLLEAKGSKKKIKECRKQAVIYGFEQCYKKNRFNDIFTLGKRLDNNIIENDSEISEFIEVAELKVEGF